MDTYTLESFIDFCDDMEIVEEGVFGAIGKSILAAVRWLVQSIQTLFRKITGRAKQDKKLAAKDSDIAKLQAQLDQLYEERHKERIENVNLRNGYERAAFANSQASSKIKEQDAKIKELEVKIAEFEEASSNAMQDLISYHSIHIKLRICQELVVIFLITLE